MSLNVTTRIAMDVASIVKRQFGDEAGVQLTDPDIIRWINDGQREINEKNKVLTARATTASVAGQDTYSLPTGAASSISSIQWDGMPVKGIPYAEAENYILTYTAAPYTGANSIPVVWYMWAGQITFWPKPVGDNATIAILYTAVPAAVTNLGDTLSLPDSYFNTLVQYVLSQAYEMDEDWDAANYKSQQFTQNLDSVADNERTTQDMTYPVIPDVTDF